MSLDTLSSELQELLALRKDLDKKIEAKRTEFMNVARNQAAKSKTLPTKRVEIPEEFFVATEMSEDTFLETRYPSWDLEEREEQDDVIVFHLKKNPEYVPFSYVNEEGKFRIGKEIQEYDPKIDWESLRAANPEIFDTVVKETVVYELDYENLSAQLEDQAELLDILARHFILRKPAQKLSPVRAIK